jgi:tetrahydromethanopterin S-methyltransferase subunit G
VESHYVELTGWTVGEAVGQLYGLVVDDYLSDWLAGESPDPLDEGDRP